MKTIDGIRLRNVIRAAEEAGIEVRVGNSHPYVLNFSGVRPCPLAASTHAERMVAPWMAQATGKTKKEAYSAIRNGYWG